jgi:hypothetical protein
MFIDNKYTKWYNDIINNAKLRNITTRKQAKAILGYPELHHIIPKCIGGTDAKENTVFLTGKEHFICHWLLTKCVLDGKEKLCYALWLMMNIENHLQTRYKITSRKYEILKKLMSEVFSKSQKGRTHSEETKQKMSATRKQRIADGMIVVNENKEKYTIISEKRKGTHHSKETKDKISKANKGKIVSDEQRQYLSKLNTGKIMSDETKKKLSETLKEDYKSGKRKKVAGMKGKTLSAEAKEKIRQARIAYWKRIKEGTQ